MHISKHINTEVITIIVSTIAIVFSINSVRTDLDNKIDKVYEAVTARINQLTQFSNPFKSPESLKARYPNNNAACKYSQNIYRPL